MVRQRSCAPRSVRGRKICRRRAWPRPSLWPVPRDMLARRSPAGIWTWMPAPSPVLPSASTAPRCQTAFSASMPRVDDVARAACRRSRRRGRRRRHRARRRVVEAVRRRRLSARCDARSWRRRSSADRVRRPLTPPRLRPLQRDLRLGCRRAIASAASRPSRIAQTTSEAPRTMSPAANTPARLVIMVRWSIFSVPQRVTASSGAPNSRRQILGVEAERLDDEIGLDVEVRAVDRSRRLAAGGVGHAEMHARGAHAGDVVVRRRGRLRARQPDELDALFLGVRHLALRARHVGAVAAIEARAPTSRPGAPRCARNPSRCRRRR